MWIPVNDDHIILYAGSDGLEIKASDWDARVSNMIMVEILSSDHEDEKMSLLRQCRLYAMLAVICAVCTFGVYLVDHN